MCNPQTMRHNTVTPPCITIETSTSTSKKKQRQATSYNNISITYQISCWICFIQFTPSCPLLLRYLLFCISSGIFDFSIIIIIQTIHDDALWKQQTSSLHTHTHTHTGKIYFWITLAWQQPNIAGALEYFSSQSLHNHKKKWTNIESERKKKDVM